MRLYAGVDGGGTRTRAVVAHADLVPRGRGAAGPANAATTPTQSVLTALVESIEDACDAAGVGVAELAAVSAGIAGIAASGLKDRIREALERSLRGPVVVVCGDAEAALAGATRDAVGSPAVVLIAGTGTVAFGRNARGDEARAGGWGPLIGDEGSGFAVGRRALAAIAQDVDGRGPSTLMREMLFSGGEPGSPAELLEKLYGEGTRPADIAAYFPLAVEAAKRGDAQASRILHDAGVELGRAAVSVVRRLSMESERFTVATSGGVFVAGEVLLAPLRDALHAVAPGAELGPPAYPPEIGAIRLALGRERLR